MIQKIFFIIGFACLGLYGFFVIQARAHQAELETELFQPRFTYKPASAPARTLKEGDLFGRLEIPRLDMSVMVMQGVDPHTLRLGAGRIPGTEMAIAAHRDTFFRPLRKIAVNDIIRFTTPEGAAEYRVVSTQIVGPKETSVLDRDSSNLMTLVTCYPFSYIGPAPERFIVQAEKN